MIPHLLVLHVHQCGHRRRIWLPLWPLFLLLSPLLLLVLVVALIGCLIARVPLRAPWVVWNVLRASKGTQIEVQDGDTSVFLKIS